MDNTEESFFLPETSTFNKRFPMKKNRCMFCGKEATGTTQLDNYKLTTCSDWDCKRKKTIIFKILIGDLSNETVLKMARCIPEDELYWKPLTSASQTSNEGMELTLNPIPS